MAKGAWEADVAYRQLTASSWFVGKQVREDKAPFARPLYLNIQSIDLTLAYGVTDRLSLTATMPFSHGTHSRYYGDGNRHEVSASGIGDVNAAASYWLFAPRSHPAGNLAVGIGVKAPTGSHSVTADYALPADTVRFTVDQSIQPGDGGWGLMLQAQGVRRLGGGFVYGSGTYLLSPGNQTDVFQGQSGPYSTIHVSIPDVYHARVGAAHRVSPRGGLVASLGARIDGIPLRDLVGRSDGFRRPVVLGYLDAGLTISRGRSAVTVNVPIRIYEDFRPSLVDRQLGTAGGGDLAKYLLFTDFRFRF